MHSCLPPTATALQILKGKGVSHVVSGYSSRSHPQAQFLTTHSHSTWCSPQVIGSFFREEETKENLARA